MTPSMICKAPGCTTYAGQYALCVRHHQQLRCSWTPADSRTQDTIPAQEDATQGPAVKGPCSHPDCIEDAVRRGLCAKHYMQQRRRDMA